MDDDTVGLVSQLERGVFEELRHADVRETFTTDAVVDRSSWEQPRIFQELQRIGAVSAEEMAKVFNLGIGMIVTVPATDVSDAVRVIGEHGHRAWPIGEVVANGSGSVRLE